MPAEEHLSSDCAALGTRVDYAILAASEHVLSLQSAEGNWKWPQESNATIDAEDILLRHFLGISDEQTTTRTARWIRARQRADATWATFGDGPPELSTTVEAYVALRIAGDSADSDHMRAAARWIRTAGGAESARVFTRIWLAMLGLGQWDDLPTLPPELILLPKWIPLNIYDWACWARQTLVPLTVVSHFRPVRPVSFTIGELARDPNYRPDKPPDDVVTRLFHAADRALRVYHHAAHRFKPLRRHALRRVESWILARQEADGSWGGLQPPHVYSIIALHLLGFPLSHPVLAAGLRGLDGFVVHAKTREGPARWIEGCQGPVWDTALVLNALLDSGFDAGHPAVSRTVEWLLDKEIRAPGDWARRRGRLAPGGWSFEYANQNYPDIDDTAEVVRALTRVYRATGRADARVAAAIRRGLNWVAGMRSSDGGWAAFDADNTSRLARKVPFCDFGEATDPPSADVTAHVVEMLAQHLPAGHDMVAGGTRWLLDHQEPDGSWFGRWAVNHVFGVGAVVPALIAAALPADHPAIRRAVEWLRRHQNEDGGWGEDPRSYDDATWVGRGESTPSQTSWALLALAATGECSPSMHRGLAWLVDHQLADGGWEKSSFTGTGFPGDYYINYHSYHVVFPLSALGACAAVPHDRTRDRAARRA